MLLRHPFWFNHLSPTHLVRETVPGPPADAEIAVQFVGDRKKGPARLFVHPYEQNQNVWKGNCAYWSGCIPRECPGVCIVRRRTGEFLRAVSCELRLSAEVQAPKEARSSCSRDRMTIRHEGTVPGDFVLGEIVTLGKAGAIVARSLGEIRLRIHLKPMGRAGKGATPGRAT